MELSPEDKVLLQRANEKMSAANEVLRFLADYFRDKYGLTPDNQITPDGRIISIGPTQFSLDGAEAIPNEVG